MKPTSATACLLLTAAVSVAVQAGPARTPGSHPWDASAAQNVAAVTWSSDEVATFLAKVTDSDDQVTVGDFKFANLLGDGRIELVASVDYSGRGFFNTVLVVRRNGAAYSVQKLPALGVGSLSGVVVDLNGDGKQELVIPTPLTPYLGGAYPQAKWDAVYAWTGTLYAESAAAFTGYYSARALGALRQRLVEASVANDRVLLAQARIEYNKVLTVLPAGNSDAAIATGRSLAGDADRRLRIWGAAVLADIDDPEAEAALGALVGDADPEVASYAVAAHMRSRASRCDRIDITILGAGPLPTVNLAAADPIRVTVPAGAKRGSGQQAIVASSVTFGETGQEHSLLRCKDGDLGSGKIVCEFGAGQSGLRVGDGVATLAANRVDGTCVTGKGAVQVIAD